MSTVSLILTLFLKNIHLIDISLT